MSARHQCRYCNRRLLDEVDPSHPLRRTRDHVIAKSRGGTHRAPCCRQCNQLKADMPLLAWARFMQANPEWWLRFRTHGQVLKADPAWPTRKERKTTAWRSHAIRSRLKSCPVHVAMPPLCRGLTPLAGHEIAV